MINVFVFCFVICFLNTCKNSNLKYDVPYFKLKIITIPYNITNFNDYCLVMIVMSCMVVLNGIISMSIPILQHHCLIMDFHTPCLHKWSHHSYLQLRNHYSCGLVISLYRWDTPARLGSEPQQLENNHLM